MYFGRCLVLFGVENSMLTTSLWLALYWLIVQGDESLVSVSRQGNQRYTDTVPESRRYTVVSPGSCERSRFADPQ